MKCRNSHPAINSFKKELKMSKKTINTSVTIPNGTKIISIGAYKNRTDIISIRIPPSVEKISKDAFFGCTNLKRVTIPSSVITIGDSAFNGCKNLRRVTIKNGVKKIGVNAFKGCVSLEFITIPGSVERVTAHALNGLGHNFDNGIFINFCHGVKILDKDAIHECKINNLTLPEGITTIRGGAFRGSNIKSITIPESVTLIGNGALPFKHELERIYLPLEATGKSKSMLKRKIKNAGSNPDLIYWLYNESVNAQYINPASVKKVQMSFTSLPMYNGFNVTVEKEKLPAVKWDTFLDLLYREYLLLLWKNDYSRNEKMDGSSWNLIVTYKNGKKDLYEGQTEFPEYCNFYDVAVLFKKYSTK